MNPSGNGGNSVYDLLIIAPGKFTSALQPLVVHKNDVAEVSTILVTTSEIYDGDYFPVEGRDKPEEIKYFIKNAYDEWGIKYVLLVGDFRLVPIRYCYIVDPTTAYDPYYISELYYADIYDGNGSFSSWDTDGDGIYSEWHVGEVAEDQPIDLYPDVCVGRLACRNTNEVKAVVNKIITYETSTYDKSWFKKIIGAGGDAYPDLPGNEHEESVLKVFENFSDDWTKISLFASDGTITGPQDVNSAVTQGAGFLYIRAHSSPYTWSTHPPGSKEWITGGTIITYLFMFNGGKLPVAVAPSCHNSQFDVNFWRIFEDDPNWMTWIPECLNWKLTRLPWGGTIATIGNTGLGYTKEDKPSQEGAGDYLHPQLFYEYANVQSSDILGELWKTALSNYLDKYPIDWNTTPGNDSSIDAKVVQVWTLFGDPSLKIGGYDVEGDSSEFEAANVENIGVNCYTSDPVQSQGNGIMGEVGNTGTFVNIESVPDTPFDPTSWEPGAEYTFTALVTGSPSYDQICYFFDWGDETYSDPVGPYPRDQIAEAKHVWNDSGEYEVRVIAWLINSESDWLINLESSDYWEETGWSDPLVVAIDDGTSNHQQSSNPLFFQILQRLMNIR